MDGVEHAENNGLVGKLKDVDKGDPIRIFREVGGNSDQSYEAVGCVLQVDDRTVTLSTDHPLHTPPMEAIVSWKELFKRSGNRKPQKGITYDLLYFDNYVHLREVEEKAKH